MTAPTEIVAGDLPPGLRRGSGRPLGWWGTVAMIVTEAMLFALLLYVYSQLRVEAERWPLGTIAEPELAGSGLRTALLLASSVPMHLADRAAAAGDQAKLRWSLATGWLMGALFLAGHAGEWSKLLQEFTPTTNAYGSAFYVITGFHALHLAIGLVIAGFLWSGAMAGRYGVHHHGPVSNGVLYWHFVDVVWVFVFGVLYLSVSWP